MVSADASGDAPAPNAPLAPAADATPMIAQYLEIKSANADSLLFYRMGDFYEMFFDDAAVASRALGIALTKRGKYGGEDIPMCGVPVHAADDYLQRLIAQGFRVAVCEQTEDPADAKKRGPKSVVRRDVVRLVTPGTLTEESLLDARAHNFLTALFRAPQSGEAICALASIDISTGELIAASVRLSDLPGELARIKPGEVLVGDDLASDADMRRLIGEAGAALTPCPRAHFDSVRGERMLKERLGVATLDAYGDFTRAELAALAGLLTYVEITQVGRAPLLRPPRKEIAGSLLVIDAATRANLELARSSQGVRSGSLLAAIDRTVTAAGTRELASRIASPSTDIALVNARLDAVTYLVNEPRLRQTLREALKAPDLARALARLALGRGGPRDLGAVRDAIGAAHGLAAHLLRAGEAFGLPRELMGIAERLAAAPSGTAQSLAAALAEELPVNARDGGYIRAGFNADLDGHRKLRDGSRQVIAGLQATYADATGVKGLKVRHNNVLGYFVEVTALHAGTLTSPPHVETFIHRQTMANAVRFSTAELAELEARITSAADRALALELDVFTTLIAEVLNEEQSLSAASAGLAELDHFAGLAELAAEKNYVRPVIDGSLVFAVEEARHPMVEQNLRRGQATGFIGNDCKLCDESRDGGTRVLVVTGPNMAGKSTFLRQNALLVVLAQAGSFVPAKAAHIGIVDRLFSRVGAADDLARGRSTFMVEMVETASILNQATARSFVVLDEIGRGTATFDGLSIAWAALEYLHEVNRSRVLFATHYHELTALAEKLAHAANATVEVKEWRDEIVFLYRVVPGAADRSYGIHVAKLAGLPGPVLARAGEVLRELEKADGRPKPADLADDLPLFQATKQPAGLSEPSALEQALTNLNPDAMTPKEALEALYRLKTLLESEA